jgi:ParB/RepB/Spo0J family partition protein
MEIIKIPISKIESLTDRIYGGIGDIKVLAESINAVGIIHPPAVKELTDKKGYYRIIAGRRRVEAAKSLGWKNIEVTLHPKNADEEAIALAENVNREDMHPLDEAEKFKREVDSGKTVDEVAKLYARSISGIQQRLRLTKLLDGIKTMFRDGKINLSGAALIASLPEEDQEKFLKKFADKNSIGTWEITNFISSVQRFKIKHVADKKCEKCKTRTFISTPGLFEDYNNLEDVCFNQECYAEKWKALIGKLIAKEETKEKGKTDTKIILNRGIPNFLPPKTKAMTIGDVEYTLLPQNNYSWNEAKGKTASNTAWLVSEEWFQSSGSYDVKAKRVKYETANKVNYSGSSSSKAEQNDPIKTFYIDLLPEIKPEEKKDIAEKMKKKHEYAWHFFNDIEKGIMETIIDKRLHSEDKESVAALFVEENCEGEGKTIDPDYQPLFDMVFGTGFDISQIPTEPYFDKLFRVLLAISLENEGLPGLRDTEEEWQDTEKTIFWRFAQITREEYTEYYKKLLTEAIRMETSGVAAADEPKAEEAQEISYCNSQDAESQEVEK